MRIYGLIAAALAMGIFTAGLCGEEKKQDKSPSFWMKQKLTYSQRILNGLATEDYDLILQNANAMKGLDTLEFFVRQKPEGYRTHLKTFQFAVKELARNAEDKDLDGATLAFTQMTVSCVNCHKQIRSQ